MLLVNIDDYLSDALFELTFEESLTPGFRFDYVEQFLLRVSVEVEHVTRTKWLAADITELQVRVIDNTYSRPRRPKSGFVFHPSFALGHAFSNGCWLPFREGHLARWAVRTQ